MADATPARRNYIKIVFGSFLGLCTGGVMMYANALFDRVVKPPKPVANFSAGPADGLTANFQVMASGQSGWWDFGDGSALEPFDPEKTQVTHAYAKPGNYKVGLTVRNFLMEENDRSISVELTAPAAGPNALPPAVKGWKVEAVSGTQAPATFHVTGELENADEVIWRLGNDKTEHLTAQTGPIDKYVRIDQPGTQHIVLTAFSKAKKDPQVLVHAVDVQVQKSAVYNATLTVTDSAEKVDRIKMTENQPVLVRDKAGNATRGFTRVITAGANCTLASIELDKAAKPIIRRDSVKIVMAADKKSATVTGEWGLTGDALFRAAGGSDVTIPLVVMEERVTRLSPRTSQLSGTLNDKQQIVIPVPATRPGESRSMTVDFGLLMPGPAGKPSVQQSVARGALDAAGNWTGKAKLGGKDTTIVARTVSGKVIVTFQ